MISIRQVLAESELERQGDARLMKAVQSAPLKDTQWQQNSQTNEVTEIHAGEAESPKTLRDTSVSTTRDIHLPPKHTRPSTAQLKSDGLCEGRVRVVEPTSTFKPITTTIPNPLKLNGSVGNATGDGMGRNAESQALPSAPLSDPSAKREKDLSTLDPYLALSGMEPERVRPHLRAAWEMGYTEGLLAAMRCGGAK